MALASLSPGPPGPRPQAQQCHPSPEALCTFREQIGCGQNFWGAESPAGCGEGAGCGCPGPALGKAAREASQGSPALSAQALGGDCSAGEPWGLGFSAPQTRGLQ